MIKKLNELKELLSSQSEKRRVAVVCAHDEHTLEAVAHAMKDDLIYPILIGNAEIIRKMLSQYQCSEKNIVIIEENDSVSAAQIAVEMVKKGEVDSIMKGKIETGTLMKILVNRENGIRKAETMSLLAVMESPNYHKVFGLTDPGLLTYPNIKQKEAEIRNAVDAFHALGIKNPKVALLCATEKVNPKMQETVEADELKSMDVSDCIIEGPISLDLAIDQKAATIKGYTSPVAGDADILVVSEIVSGNILAKSITVLGGGKTCGIVLGAQVPVILVSRSASAEDKYYSIVLGALIGRNK